MALSAKQQRFVQEYLVDLNATQAAVRAGYSEHTAKQQGSRLLSNADIAAYLKAQQNTSAEKAGVTLEWLIEEGKGLMMAAKSKEDFSAASSTYERLAKISGHWIDRSANDTNMVQRVFSSEPMTEEDWRKSLNGHAH